MTFKSGWSIDWLVTQELYPPGSACSLPQQSTTVGDAPICLSVLSCFILPILVHKTLWYLNSFTSVNNSLAKEGNTIYRQNTMALDNSRKEESPSSVDSRGSAMNRGEASSHRKETFQIIRTNCMKQALACNPSTCLSIGQINLNNLLY